MSVYTDAEIRAAGLPVPLVRHVESQIAALLVVYCTRCNRRRTDRWARGDHCCTWWGGYRGRHRRRRR